MMLVVWAVGVNVKSLLEDYQYDSCVHFTFPSISSPIFLVDRCYLAEPNISEPPVDRQRKTGTDTTNTPLYGMALEKISLACLPKASIAFKESGELKRQQVLTHSGTYMHIKRPP